MPSVTYNGQSFAIDGRRFWILGATIDYARTPPEYWAARIAAARDAGFNTIVSSCPWCVHEPRIGRFDFTDGADVAQFVRTCSVLGMRAILRIGPFVGQHFDGGGLPNWLTEIPDIRLRESNEPFFERVIAYFRKLLSEVEELQVTRGGRGGGPLLLLQLEHAWLCSNPKQQSGYLRELSRLVRECGITVPLINANDLWQEIPGTIDTWRGGYEAPGAKGDANAGLETLAHLRQLRTVQSDAPRLLSEFDLAGAAGQAAWGDVSLPPSDAADGMLAQLAQCLAAGAQPIVSPFAGGMNFGFLGGRMVGSPDRFAVTSASAGGPMNEQGVRNERYVAIKRLMTFANHFSHVFAELSPEYHPIVAVPDETGTARGEKSGAQSAPLTAVPLQGSQGSIVFLFATGGDGKLSPRRQRQARLLLANGLVLPVALGASGVSWVALDVDLGGVGRLDYANVCPYALVNRSILVLFGPRKAPVHLSISGSPLTASIPTGERPWVGEHKGLTIVLLNEEQVDSTYLGKEAVFVGAGGLTLRGEPLPKVVTGNGKARSAATSNMPWKVDSDGALSRVTAEEAGDSEQGAAKGKAGQESGMSPGHPIVQPSRSTPRRVALQDWQGSSSLPYAQGASPRFATLDGPCTLAAAGAQVGYGWYRVRFTCKSGKRRRCHWPEAAHRVHVYLDEKPLGVVGAGPGAMARPFEVHLSKGEHTLVALAENFGRFAGGNDLGERTGVFGDLLEIKALRASGPKQIDATPVDPFVLRGYIEMLAKGQLSTSQQFLWTFTHARKSPVLVDVQGVQQSGTFVLNDAPIAYYPGATGAAQSFLLIGQTTHEAFRRGKNELRFAPDAHQDVPAKDVSDGVKLYECAEAITEGGEWAFAKWEPPGDRTFEPVTKAAAKRFRNAPAWWRCTFATPRRFDMPLWFDTSGMSKGQVFINGRNLGRYFTATATGKSIGPQTKIAVPASWLHAEKDNEILLFDEHGFDPFRARLRMSLE